MRIKNIKGIIRKAGIKNTNQIIAVAPRTGMSVPVFIGDEGHRFFAPPAAPMNTANWKKHSTRFVIQTQAVMRFNSGKRVRHICLAHYEDTGESVVKKPRKFLPAQALRRGVI